MNNNPLGLVAILAGVFLISFSGLMLEVTITRIFSTTIWYHYAFVAISVALFGWGFGGLFLHFLGPQRRQKTLPILAISALTLSFSIPIYLWAILQFPISPSHIAFYLTASTVPFFLGGVCIALLFESFSHLASRVYFADLTGASFGCLCVEPTLSVLGAESTTLMLGVTASVASLLFSLASRKRKLIALSIVGLTITASIFLNNTQHSSLSVSNAPGKTLFRTLEANPQLRLVLTKWNSFSRVDVVEGPLGQDLAIIFIDADATTEVLRWDGTLQSAQHLKQTMDFLPYNLVSEPKTLIIGSGGGRDVIIALIGGSSKIIAVELNPIIVDIVKNYGESAGNVYDQDKVDVVVDEGRSFISRSNEKYDAIILTLVDSWAAIAAGGYALAENYLYTVEAFQQYFDHLTDDGFLMMIRWDIEVPRLISTVVATLQTRGKSITEAGKHIAIVLNQLEPGKTRALLMLKKTPFNETQAEEIRNHTIALGSSHQIYYLPYFYDRIEPYAGLFGGAISLQQFYANFSYRVEPVTDDNPYYFCIEKPLPQTLNTLIMSTSLLVSASIAVPWFFKRRKAPKSGSALSFVVFFSALGLAYMLLEVALIQKFILFLGYPTRALSIILFSLLLSSGIGSFVSGWASDKREIVKNILFVCPLIITIVAVYALSLSSLFAAWLPQDAMVRTLLSIVLLFPLGFLMGIPFPTGVRILSGTSDQSVPWMWGINGAMSVLGSVLVTAIGIVWGFNYAMACGATAYFSALLCAWHWRSRNVEKL